MDDIDRLIETARFLTARKLSDSFQDSEARVRRGFSDVGGDVEELERRLAAIEAQLLGISVYLFLISESALQSSLL